MKNLKSVFISLLLLVVVGAGALALFWPQIRGKILVVMENQARASEYRAVRDVSLAVVRRTADESADYVIHKLGMPRTFPDKFALFDEALKRVDPKLSGMYCEFGVYTGGTINYVASKVNDTLVHGFDSFEGLPENWRAGFAKGTFAVKELPGVRSNVRLYKGWFKDSLPIFKKEHPEPLAFGHLDADLYVSTKDVFDALGDRIVEGTVLQFDEFLNYPGWQDGEVKAFTEFCEARACEVEYIGYVPTSEQLALRIKKISPLAAK